MGPGNAPVYVHRSADVRMAVVDMLISKTFDASVICPAEQTCVVDERDLRRVIAEFERMGARVLTDEEVEALAAAPSSRTAGCDMDALGQSCANLAAMAGFEVGDDAKVLLAPLPADLDELAATRSSRRS